MKKSLWLKMLFVAILAVAAGILGELFNQNVWTMFIALLVVGIYFNVVLKD